MKLFGSILETDKVTYLFLVSTTIGVANLGLVKMTILRWVRTLAREQGKVSEVHGGVSSHNPIWKFTLVSLLALSFVGLMHASTLAILWLTGMRSSFRPDIKYPIRNLRKTLSCSNRFLLRMNHI